MAVERLGHWHDGIVNDAQRWLSIGAFGAGGAVVADTVNSWLVYNSSNGGWFNYAPSNGVSFP